MIEENFTQTQIIGLQRFLSYSSRQECPEIHFQYQKGTLIVMRELKLMVLDSFLSKDTISHILMISHYPNKSVLKEAIILTQDINGINLS